MRKSKWIIFPQIGMNIKKFWVATGQFLSRDPIAPCPSFDEDIMVPQPPTMLPAPPLQKTGGIGAVGAIVDSGSTVHFVLHGCATETYTLED